jgi:endogenous inhibitor of DNA gyrase (YacG/DUF329 family)
MAGSKPDNPGQQAAGKCPICGAPPEHKYRPFCSRRCADVDLSRWLKGAYAIPDEAEDEDGASTDAPAVEDGDDAAGRKRRE